MAERKHSTVFAGRLRFFSALYISTFFIRASFAILLVGLPVYLERAVVGTAQLGVVQGASPAAEMVSALFIGVLVDRYGRKGMLLLGLTAGALAFFGVSLSTNLYFQVAMGAVHGFSAAAILVSSLALMADYAPPGERGKMFGLFDGVNLSGWGVGFAAGGVLIDRFSGDLGMVFVIGALPALAALAYAFINISEPKKGAVLSQATRFGEIAAVLKERRLLLLILPWFILYMLIGIVLAFSSYTGKRDFNIEGWKLGALLGGGCIVIMLTQTVYGRLSDRFGRGPMMLVGSSGVAGLLATLGAVFYISGGPARMLGYLVDHPPFIAAAGVFVLMAAAFAPAALAGLADDAPKRHKGVPMGMYSVVISLGMAVGPVVSGAIAQYSGPTGLIAFLAGSAFMMVLLVLIRGWMEKGGGKGRKAGGEEE